MSKKDNKAELEVIDIADEIEKDAHKEELFRLEESIICTVKYKSKRYKEIKGKIFEVKDFASYQKCNDKNAKDIEGIIRGPVTILKMDYGNFIEFETGKEMEVERKIDGKKVKKNVGIGFIMPISDSVLHHIETEYRDAGVKLHDAYYKDIEIIKKSKKKKKEAEDKQELKTLKIDISTDIEMTW